ncbi:hypothetical protein Ddye_021494 [Dipteronia dyeriana]|uniref:Uncharacterized protein n=1 Tax=Dipteronia dyeriana TaxID=168575 RepID=A0AAD9U1R3_9ROSI|nr:hypothetical protein Ddye_021494 [Dipteronia dyeriana]
MYRRVGLYRLVDHNENNILERSGFEEYPGIPGPASGQASLSTRFLEQKMNSWRLTGFYGHPEPTQRHHAWTFLRRLRDMSSLPWVCVGDLMKFLKMRRSWMVFND